MNGHENMQMTMFDLFASPSGEAAVDAPGRVVRCSIQASAALPDGNSFRIFGTARDEISLPGWKPSARDVLALFPVSFSYYLSRGMLDRGDVIDLFAHELDADGNRLNMLADAHVTITGGELMDAVESL